MKEEGRKEGRRKEGRKGGRKEGKRKKAGWKEEKDSVLCLLFSCSMISAAEKYQKVY